MITQQDVFDYLGIDYADEVIKRTVDRIIKTTDSFLAGSLGKEYPQDDPRVKELALMIAGDLYDNRGISDKVSANMRHLADDFSLQLRLEMRG